MLSYIFTSKISQSHWLSLSFPFCQVYDYDWGLRDDFMGEASLPLGQLAPQKWNDLVLTLSETGEHFNSIQGWLWGMSFIPKPSRVCLSKTRQQNVKKLSFNNKDKITSNYRVFFWSESHYQLWYSLPTLNFRLSFYCLNSISRPGRVFGAIEPWSPLHARFLSRWYRNSTDSKDKMIIRFFVSLYFLNLLQRHISFEIFRHTGLVKNF